LLYVKNYSVKEIASKLNITRQAVNQSKIRALKNLKEYIWTSLIMEKENMDKMVNMIKVFLIFSGTMVGWFFGSLDSLFMR
jgi:Sigma-70, region 4.